MWRASSSKERLEEVSREHTPVLAALQPALALVVLLQSAADASLDPRYFESPIRGTKLPVLTYPIVLPEGFIEHDAPSSFALGSRSLRLFKSKSPLIGHVLHTRSFPFPTTLFSRHPPYPLLPHSLLRPAWSCQMVSGV
eukprot:3876476-Rhodomonas_salina.2